MRGRIERRLALALVLTALTPVLSGIWLSRSLVRQSSDRFFVPEIGEHLEQSLQLYGELAGAVKADLRSSALAISRSPPLLKALAATARDDTSKELESALRTELGTRPEIVSLTARSANGTQLARAARDTPLDHERELQLRVVQPFAQSGELIALFSQPRKRFEQAEEMNRFFQTYSHLVARREEDESTYLYAFAVLLGITIIAAVGVGGLLARGVARRVTRLAAAARRVGAGDFDLSVRMGGNDEISDLATTFNQMVREVESNRSRIEYLQRLTAWQDMARRLAHEIKNPLTPILLSVQELHERYQGQDETFGNLLDVARQVVESEVGTLRRLVTEFSNFARLPKASTQEDNFFSFLEDQEARLGLLENKEAQINLLVEKSEVRPMVALDRQMFQRALINLVENAAHACSKAEGGGRVLVSASVVDDTHVQLRVEDNGPGVPAELRPTLFDPYVTHKDGGTGLGLAIVKKIVIEHGGQIEVRESPLGGALFSIELPLLASSVSLEATF